MTILVTGAYGFIGSAFVEHLNALGIQDIDVSDYLSDGRQFINLSTARFRNFVHPDKIEVTQYTKVFHFGAISDTTCWDGDLVMKRNHTFTLDLVARCKLAGVFISYSSSASVYGNGNGPLNLYAYSKYLVDQHIADNMGFDGVQGFRYFNVYSHDNKEWHKGKQASPYYTFKQQALRDGVIRVFEGSNDFCRDFISVQNVCKIQWEMSNYPGVYGLFDLGTGEPKSFTQVANETSALYGGMVTTIPFPKHLEGHYQKYTCADMSYLTQIRRLKG